MADSVTYEYDLNGRLKNLTFANSDELNVEYDDMGNRTETEITIAPPLRQQSATAASQAASDVSVTGDVADEKSETSEPSEK